MRRMLGVSAVLMAATLVGVSATAEEDPYAKAGERLYHQHCGACHGITAEGNGPISSVLDPKPPDLTRIAERHGGSFPQAAVQRMIDGRDPVVAHGSREMPVWGRRFGEGAPTGPGSEAFVRGQVLLLVQYLESIQK